MTIGTVLVANRGEIACRIFRSVRALGLRTVAVYSEADAEAPHVLQADEAICLGPAAASESYLNLDRIMEAARQSGADAIHPGYGFFSENPDLPERCQKAGLTWIGPPTEAIRLMGDKRAARLAVAARGVPCVPGYDGEVQSDERLLKEAQRIGFPLMVKASMGGGGKGMRLVHDLEGVPDALQTARREAAAAFGDGSLILERAVVEPKHVEVQIFADGQGSVVHLGERECSLQRRHQKVIEEAPSPALDESLRARMGTAAVEVARAVDYVGAGTVEFLLDADGSFYFLEMNTRIQVEHPVTEAIYDVDLVAWQIQIADGAALPFDQETLDQRRSGHAMEARLYAEDPAQNFLPQAGPVHRWIPPSGLGIRVDDGLGRQVSSDYDPMLAKVIAHGPDRETARRRLLRALEGTVFFGPNHNIAFLRRLLEAPPFIDGSAHTQTIDQHFMPPARPLPESWIQALAAVLVSAPSLDSEPADSVHSDGWSTGLANPWPVRVEVDTQGYQVPGEENVSQAFLEWQITPRSRHHFQALLKADPSGLIDGSEETPSFELRDLRLIADGQACSATINGNNRRLTFHRAVNDPKRRRLWLETPTGDQLRCVDRTYHLSQGAEEGDSDQRISAPMNAKVISVRCAPGDAVNKGDTLLILEAMKLEHQINAPFPGVIAELYVAEGDQVSPQQQLAEIQREVDQDTSDASEGAP